MLVLMNMTINIDIYFVQYSLTFVSEKQQILY